MAWNWKFDPIIHQISVRHGYHVDMVIWTRVYVVTFIHHWNSHSTSYNTDSNSQMRQLVIQSSPESELRSLTSDLFWRGVDSFISNDGAAKIIIATTFSSSVDIYRYTLNPHQSKSGSTSTPFAHNLPGSYLALSFLSFGRLAPKIVSGGSSPCDIVNR